MSSGEMPDWFEPLVVQALTSDEATEYMDEINRIIDQFVDDMTNDFQK